MEPIAEDQTSRLAEINFLDYKDFLFHYNDVGNGEVVVMLHGGGPGASGWSNFERNIPVLARAGFRVIALDCPGFGKSGEIVSNMQRGLLNAKAVLSLIDYLGIEKVHFVGNSLGASSALNFALEYPKRTGRLVLMAPGGLGSSIMQPTPCEGVKLMFQLYREPTFEIFESMLEVFVFDPSVLTQELRAYRWQTIKNSTAHLKNFAKSMELAPLSSWDISDKLDKITAESLIVWGRDDRFVPLDHALKLLALLPNADLHVLTKCGHWAQWEQAEKFNRLVINFLTK